MPVILEWGRWRQEELWGSLFTGTRLCGKFLTCKRFYLKTRKEERKEKEGKEKRKGKEGSGYLRKNILNYPLSSTLKTQKCTCTHTYVHLHIDVCTCVHICTNTHSEEKEVEFQSSVATQQSLGQSGLSDTLSLKERERDTVIFNYCTLNFISSSHRRVLLILDPNPSIDEYKNNA